MFCIAVKGATICKILIKLILSFSASASAGYPRPSILPSREAALGLHHPDLLSRPYADQLAHQVFSNAYINLFNNALTIELNCMFVIFIRL